MKREKVLTGIVVLLLCVIGALLLLPKKRQETIGDRQRDSTVWINANEPLDSLLIVEVNEAESLLPLPPEAANFDVTTASMNQLLSERKAILMRLADAQTDTVPLQQARREVDDLSRELGINKGKIDKLIFYRQCSNTDRSQPVQSYDGTLGITKEVCLANSKPVGQLQWRFDFGTFFTGSDDKGNVRGHRWGSGCLIANDLFLTAGHCFDSTEDGWRLPVKNGRRLLPAEMGQLMKVNFNYELDSRTGRIRTDTAEYPIEEIVEYRTMNLDYAILRLGKGKDNRLPGEVFHTLPVYNYLPKQGEMLMVIQHPGQGRFAPTKTIGFGNCAIHSSGQFVLYPMITTERQSSGAPVISVAKKGVVAVHTIGECGSSMDESNRGTLLSAIIPHSKTLKRLAK